MGRGLPKKYAKMGFKKGWREYKKVHNKTKRSRASNPSKKGGNKMAKRSSIIPTFMKLIRLGSLAAPLASRMLQTASNQTKLDWILQDYTGYSLAGRDFKFDRMKTGWLPYIMTSLITHAIPKVNGMMKRLIRF